MGRGGRCREAGPSPGRSLLLVGLGRRWQLWVEWTQAIVSCQGVPRAARGLEVQATLRVR